jgi:hypothetical protein
LSVSSLNSRYKCNVSVETVTTKHTGSTRPDDTPLDARGGRPLRGVGWASVGLAGGLILAACGDGQSPPEDCRAVTRSWCSESMSCLVEVGTLTRKAADDATEGCIDKSERVASCDDAKAVTEDFPACIRSLENLDCDMFDVPAGELGSVELPAVCDAVILR